MRQTLKRARDAYNNGKGLTQKETATAIGVSERFYQHIEAGTREGKGRIWDALEALFGIPQRQLRKSDAQSDYSNNEQSGVEAAMKLEVAYRDFDLSVAAVADIIEDGQLDCPDSREAAEALYNRLGNVLGKTGVPDEAVSAERSA